MAAASGATNALSDEDKERIKRMNLLPNEVQANILNAMQLSRRSEKELFKGDLQRSKELNSQNNRAEIFVNMLLNERIKPEIKFKKMLLYLETQHGAGTKRIARFDHVTLKADGNKKITFERLTDPRAHKEYKIMLDVLKAGINIESKTPDSVIALFNLLETATRCSQSYVKQSWKSWEERVLIGIDNPELFSVKKTLRDNPSIYFQFHDDKWDKMYGSFITMQFSQNAIILKINRNDTGYGQRYGQKDTFLTLTINNLTLDADGKSAHIELMKLIYPKDDADEVFDRKFVVSTPEKMIAQLHEIYDNYGPRINSFFNAEYDRFYMAIIRFMTKTLLPLYNFDNATVTVDGEYDFYAMLAYKLLHGQVLFKTYPENDYKYVYMAHSFADRTLV